MSYRPPSWREDHLLLGHRYLTKDEARELLAPEDLVIADELRGAIEARKRKPRPSTGRRRGRPKLTAAEAAAAAERRRALTTARMRRKRARDAKI